MCTAENPLLDPAFVDGDLYPALFMTPLDLSDKNGNNDSIEERGNESLMDKNRS